MYLKLHYKTVLFLFHHLVQKFSSILPINSIKCSFYDSILSNLILWLARINFGSKPQANKTSHAKRLQTTIDKIALDPDPLSWGKRRLNSNYWGRVPKSIDKSHMKYHTFKHAL